MLRLLFIYFQVWDGEQHYIPQVWQVVLPNVLIQSRIVHSYVHGFFDFSSHIVSLPAYDFDVFLTCCVTSVILVLINWWWSFQMFFIHFSKIPDDTPMYSHSQSILSHLDQEITLLFFVIVSLSLGDTNKFFRVIPPLKCTCTPYFWQMFLKLLQVPCVYGPTMWNFFPGGWWNMPISGYIVWLMLFLEDFIYGQSGILALPEDFL